MPASRCLAVLYPSTWLLRYSVSVTSGSAILQLSHHPTYHRDRPRCAACLRVCCAFLAPQATWTLRLHFLSRIRFLDLDAEAYHLLGLSADAFVIVAAFRFWDSLCTISHTSLDSLQPAPVTAHQSSGQSSGDRKAAIESTSRIHKTQEVGKPGQHHGL